MRLVVLAIMVAMVLAIAGTALALPPQAATGQCYRDLHQGKDGVHGPIRCAVT